MIQHHETEWMKETWKKILKAETKDMWFYLLAKVSDLQAMSDQLYRKHIGFMGTRSNPTDGSFLLLDYFHVGKPVMSLFPISSSSWKIRMS